MDDSTPPTSPRAGDDEELAGAQSAGARRRRILESARRLFAEHGYDALSVVAVADAAGVPRSSVYRLYADRRELLTAVIEHDVEQLVGRLTLRIPPEGDLDAMLEVGVNVFLEFVDERRTEYELLFGHVGRLDPEVALLLRQLRERLAETYRRLFKPVLERVRGDIWPNEESLLVTHAVMALVEGATLAWLADPSMPRSRVVGIVTRMIRQALAVDGAGGAGLMRLLDSPPGPRRSPRGGRVSLRGVPAGPRRGGRGRSVARAAPHL